MNSSAYHANLPPRHSKGRGRGGESMSGRGGYRSGPTHHTTVPTLPNAHPQSLLSMPMPPGNVRGAPLQQIPGLPPQPHQGIPGQAGGRQVLIPTPTPPPQVMYPQPVPATGQVGVRPPIYPVLPPNLQQQLLFQQMQQNYSQMQQQAQAYGGAPPQQINLQLQQPTMQMQPLPVQQPYTRKRVRNAIRIINPDTGDEVKVDSGTSTSEPPQVPNLPAVVAPPLMMSSVGASTADNSLSSTRSGAPEEFRRKVAQAVSSEPRPPPPPNAIIRNPNDPKQIETRQELDVAESPPVEPMLEEPSKLLPPEAEKANLEPPTEETLVAPVPTPVPTLTPTLAPTHMGTPVVGGPGSTDEAGVVVPQEEQQLPQLEAVDSAETDISRPSEALQPERERESAPKQEMEKEGENKRTDETKLSEETKETEKEGETKRTDETKLSEETKETESGGPDSTLVTRPSPLVAEAVESATGEKSVHEVELERPIQPVQQEKPVSVPAGEELQTASEDISKSSELLSSSSLPESQDVDFISAPPPVQGTEEPPAPGTKPEIPLTTEDKRSSSEPVVTAVASETETPTDKPTSETADSGLHNEQPEPNVEGVSGQEIQPQSEVVVPPEPPAQKTEEQSSEPEPSRTEVMVEDQSSQPVIGEEADSVGRTELSEVQDREEEGRTEVAAPAEPVPEVRVRDEKTGESLAALSEKEPQKAEKPVQPAKPEKPVSKSPAEETKTTTHIEAPPPSHAALPSHAAQPSHPERTTYDRNFLLQFKNMPICQDPPDDLKRNECFRPFGETSVDHFMPFGQGGGGGGGGRKPRRNEPKRIAHQPREMEKVELKKSENPWSRQQDRQEESTEEEQKSAELYRKFQGILNKLTPQKFQSLAEQALLLEINTEERLKGVIDKIFTKALEEPSFSIAYANLCKVLSPVKVEWTTADGKQKTNNFRRVLLTKCQQEFEKDKKDDEERERMLQAIEDADTEEKKQQIREELTVIETKARRRSLGNIRFIGELFKLKMLSETIMHECVVRLLRSPVDEESLECFARLITTTGKDLDHPQAKQLIDKYFNRMTEIIKKGKVPSRIKFMLQDVQDLRANNWVQRSRQESSLKTIDQIHAEARAEEAVQKQLIQQHQHQHGMMVPMKQGGRGDDKRGRGRDREGKGGPDEWNKVERDREKRERERERDKPKVDTSRISRLTKRGEKSKEPTLGPPTSSLRPAWGKGASTATTAVPETSVKSDKEKDAGKLTKPLRSSSGGQKRSEREREREREREKNVGTRGTTSAPKRTHSQPDSHKEQHSAIQIVRDMTGKPSQKPVVPATDAVVPVQPVAGALDEDTICRKTGTIVDELAANKDFREAIECVREMKSPGMMNVFVRESVNHTLEKSTFARVCVGQLFHELSKEELLTEEKFIAGLNEVLEYAEDIEIDIPRVWDYLGEILTPALSQPPLPLRTLAHVPPPLVKVGKAADLAAKTLLQVRFQQSEAAALSLWTQSQLDWTSLGVKSEDVEEFVSRQKLEFLQSGGSAPSQTPSPYLTDLTGLFGSDNVTNDEIFDWIEKNCLEVTQSPPPRFIRVLTTAVIQGTVAGSGTSAVFEDERFKKRLMVLKKYVDENQDLQMEVLYALQITVAKLEHPPKLLNNMFNVVYDVDVVSEQVFCGWRDKGTETFGKGNSVISVKTFFDWLDCAETESDGEGGERDERGEGGERGAGIEAR